MNDELLAYLVTPASVLALVSLCKRYVPGINGWTTALLTLVVSVAAQLGRVAVSGGDTWAQASVTGLAVAIILLGGDTYAQRIVGKVGSGGDKG